MICWTLFVLASILLRCMAWLSTGLILGAGWNVEGRYDSTVPQLFVAGTLASMIPMILLRDRCPWWLAALASAAATIGIDAFWLLGHGLISGARAMVVFWESFWPAGIAFAFAKISSERLSKLTLRYY